MKNLKENKLNSQEIFWKGEFGDQYINRNKSDLLLSSNINLFSKILNYTDNCQSFVELGCNIGLNLIALNKLKPKARLTGIDINKKSLSILNKNVPNIKTICSSIIKNLNLKADFVFTKGVLIHINPEDLHRVYKNLYKYSKKYILIAEYYSQNPTEIAYRGHNDKLFKRDFCKDLIQHFPDLKLKNYGFCYRYDNNFPQDDLNWFLLEKS